MKRIEQRRTQREDQRVLRAVIATVYAPLGLLVVAGAVISA